MSKVIKVELTTQSINNAIKELKRYKQWLLDKTKEFIDELAKAGFEVAKANFDKAEYDGTKDVTVTVETRQADSDKEILVAVVAIGQSVLFLEFGTGVTYSDDHPEKPDGILARGTYGKGKGKQPTWGYYGEDTGKLGWYATTKQGAEKVPHVVLTHGVPASQSLYNARKDVRDKVYEIAKRVYVYD